jgi:5-(carboxyamino)imidazole ribonucleotide synthase
VTSVPAREPAFVCSRCGHDLTGSTLDRCPECGGTTTAREVRLPATLLHRVAGFALAIELLVFAGYFAINPNDIGAFNLSTKATSVSFSLFFALGAAASAWAVGRPRSLLLRGILVALIILGAMHAALETYFVGLLIYNLSEVTLTLLVASVVTLNAACVLTITNRLFKRDLVYSMIEPKPNATIGILGSGQLGRMLAQSGVSLGVTCRFLDDLRSRKGDDRVPASAVGAVDARGFDNPDALAAFAEGLHVVTYEFENVPLHAAHALEERLAVRPSARSLEVTQDRLNERDLFDRLGIDTPRHAAVETLAELRAALDGGFPLPAILKTRRLGYDGKGQARLHATDDAERAWNEATAHGAQHEAAERVPAMLDEMIPFERELSIVAVRSESGETRCYPPFENTHAHGILTSSICPAPGVGQARLAEMTGAAEKIADELDHIGVFAVEFFETGGDDARLLANEIAPRVHNTGHGTIEGCETSQFENHLRAILGLPLGSTDARGFSAMLNIIGDWPDRAALLAVPGLRLHDYDKAPKPGRKIGHVTLVAPDRATLMERVAQAEAVIAGAVRA